MPTINIYLPDKILTKLALEVDRRNMKGERTKRGQPIGESTVVQEALKERYNVQEVEEWRSEDTI